MTSDILSTIAPLVKDAEKMGASEVELFAQSIRLKEANIESNNLKTAISSIVDGVGIRVLKDKAIGFASVNSLDVKRIRDGIKDAIAIASTTPSMDHFHFSAAKKIREVGGLFDDSLNQISMDDVISYAKTMMMSALDFDPRVRVDVGSFSVFTTDNAIATSSGIEASDTITTALYLMVELAVDGDDVGSFDYEGKVVTSLMDVNVKEFAESLSERVLKNLGAEKTESFEGPAILSPDALAELADVLVQSASANKIQGGASYFQDRLGETVAIDDFTLTDDGAKAGMSASRAFDREGVPHSSHSIIEKGVFKGILYDTFTANKDNMESTGHAFGTSRGTPTISSTNLEIVPGTKSVEDMISEIDHGIYIPRISAFPDPVSGDFAGPVKGGQLIKNGEIGPTLKEITVSGNLFDSIKQVSSIGKERKLIGYPGLTWFFPHIQVEGLKFAC